MFLNWMERKEQAEPYHACTNSLHSVWTVDVIWKVASSSCYFISPAMMDAVWNYEPPTPFSLKWLLWDYFITAAGQETKTGKY